MLFPILTIWIRLIRVTPGEIGADQIHNIGVVRNRTVRPSM